MRRSFVPLVIAAALLAAACGGEEAAAPTLDPNRTGDNALAEEQIGAPIVTPTPSVAVSVSPGAETTATCVPGPEATCAGALLVNASLDDVNLRNADLTGANLTGAILRNADLRGADLTGANLNNADLTGADMRDAIFSNAKFRYTNLTEVDMEGSEGREGQLVRARLCETILPDGTRNVRNCMDVPTSPSAPTETEVDDGTPGAA